MRKPLPEVYVSTRCPEFADCATLRRCGMATVRRSYPLWGVILAKLLGWELAPNNTETKGGYD